MAFTNLSFNSNDYEDQVKIGNHFTLVKPFPISIAFTLKDYDDTNRNRITASDLLKHHGINAQYMAIGAERIDYTKALIEKFLGIERFLDKNPQYHRNFTLVQIGAVSRALLKTYADTVNAVEREISRINWKFKSKNWQPILFLKGTIAMRRSCHFTDPPMYAWLLLYMTE